MLPKPEINWSVGHTFILMSQVTFKRVCISDVKCGLRSMESKAIKMYQRCEVAEPVVKSELFFNKVLSCTLRGVLFTCV